MFELSPDRRRDRALLSLGSLLRIEILDEMLFEGRDPVHGASGCEDEAYSRKDAHENHPARHVEIGRDDSQHYADCDEGTDQDQSDDRPDIPFLLLQQLGGRCLDRAGVDPQSVDERCHHDQGDGEFDGLADLLAGLWQQPGCQRVEVQAGTDVDGDDDDSVENDPREIGLEELLPFVVFGGRTDGFPGRFEPFEPFGRDLSAEIFKERRGCLDGVRGCESRDDGNGDDDGVDEAPHHPEGASHAGNDEAELSQLGEAESDFDGIVEPFSCQDDSGSGEDDVADYHKEREEKDHHPVLEDDSGVDHHSDGDEEDRSEKVLQRFHYPFDVFSLDCLRKDGAHHEGSEGRGETDCIGEEDHAEAQAYADQQEDLVVEDVLDLAQDCGNQEYSDEEPENQEEDELEDVQHQFLAGKGLRDGHRGEEDHQEDGDQVFDDQRAEDHPRIGLLLQAEILVGLDDDHRR